MLCIDSEYKKREGYWNLSEVPEFYRCSQCGVTGVKLWRGPCDSSEPPPLFCKACALINQDESGETPDHRIGGLIPAIPMADVKGGYWGHRFSPREERKWREGLPV